MRNAWQLPSRKNSSVKESIHQDRKPHNAKNVCPKVKMTLPHAFNAHPTSIQQKSQSYVSATKSDVSRRGSLALSLEGACSSESNFSLPSHNWCPREQRMPYYSGRRWESAQQSQIKQHRYMTSNFNSDKLTWPVLHKSNDGSKRNTDVNGLAADEGEYDGDWLQDKKNFLSQWIGDSRKVNKLQRVKEQSIARQHKKHIKPKWASVRGCPKQKERTGRSRQEWDDGQVRFPRELHSKFAATTQESTPKLPRSAFSCSLLKPLRTSWSSRSVESVKQNTTKDSYSETESCNDSSVHDGETLSTSWTQRYQPIQMEADKHFGEVALYKKCKKNASEYEKANQYVKTKEFHLQENKGLNSRYQTRHSCNPCYISDNVGQIMSFFSLVEVLKAKRVSRLWAVSADITLKQRTAENLTTYPPLTAAVGSMLLSQLHVLLPRLQCLTISINHYQHLKGLVLSYICECKNLVFLRVENLEWHDLTIATKVILSLQTPRDGGEGHPILAKLQDLELPDSKLPIPTSTQCIRPLSNLAPNLCSLTVKSAQDPIIFSLRLFFPTVRTLFLLDKLWTTRRFAQIVSSSPHLMKFLMDRPKVRMLAMVAKHGTKHTASSVISKPVPMTSRMHMPGSVPVITSDERFFALVSNHKNLLYVEPLGRVIQIETGRDLTKANIGMFADFCALIGVLIIMPPMDGLVQ